MRQIRFRYQPGLTQRFLPVVVVLGAMVLMVVLANTFVTANFDTRNLALIGLLVGLPAWVWIVLNWHKAFYLVMVLVVFEGVVRNLTNGVAVLLVKDIVIGLIYLGYLRTHRFKFLQLPELRRFSRVFIALLVYCLFEVFNPASSNLLVGLVGLKTLLYYVPLLFVAYEIFDTPAKIERFGVLLLIMAGFSAALGVYQYIGGYEVIRVFQPVYIQSATRNLGTYYKLPGTFAAPGNFSAYLTICFVIGMGLLYSKTSRRLTVFSIIGILICAVALVLNIQRSAWLFALVCFFLGSFNQSFSTYVRVLRLGLAVLVIGAFGLAITSNDNLVGDTFSGFTTGGALEGYLYYAPIVPLTGRVDAILHGEILGKGIGQGAPGARYVREDDTFIEAYLSVLLYELGPVGTVLSFWLIFIAVGMTWRAYRQMQGNSYRNIIFFILLWQLFNIGLCVSYAPLSVPPTSLFFWLLPGLAMRLGQWHTQNKANLPVTGEASRVAPTKDGAYAAV